MTRAISKILKTGGMIIGLMALSNSTSYAVDGTKAKHSKPAASNAAANSQAEYEDKMITYKIRQSIANDVTLSPAAQSLKIETSKGVVAIKGPVANVGEKSIVVAMAEAVAGKANVKTEIEVPK